MFNEMLQMSEFALIADPEQINQRKMVAIIDFTHYSLYKK